LAAAILVLPFAFSSLQRFDFEDPDNVLTIEGRAMARYEAYLLFLQNPWLGVGKFNYQDRVFFTDPNAQGATHNVFVEEAAETGLLGVVPFVILLYAAFRSDFRRHKEQPWDLRAISIALSAACFAILVECLAENSLLVWQIACLFWIFRGVAVAMQSMPHDLAPLTVAPQPREI
jgi:O-antigen ligase